MNITATYRLQLRGPKADPNGRAFGFSEAEDILEYLHDLGVSHIYLSPILQSREGSAHSYDVVDPTVINPELGGIDGFRSLAHHAKSLGMGVVIDIVPNHVGIATPIQNAWWWDVLKHGQGSAYAHYFDIDFRQDNGANGRIALPVLGAEGDEKALEFDQVEGEEVLRYYEHLFPIAPGTRQKTPLETYQNQHYALLDWRTGVINYRRFFSVNDLAGIRQEDPEVFEHSHAMIRQLIEEDLIDGVRVDHPDGLADPFAYLQRLRTLIGDRWLVIEKILGVEEPLDPRLAVDGTTGYDALREFDGVFVHRSAEDALSMLALEQSGSTWNATAIAATEHMLKAEVAAGELNAEILRLLRAIRADNFSTGGHSVSEELLRETVIELVAEMPVYRADYLSLSRLTATAIADHAHRFPTRRAALDVFAAAMLANGEAATRFAQVCGAVMAKGVEDTTFYRACRLVALQEVGGAPGRFGVSAAEFHMLQQERAKLWPRAMTTLSTHDTKRSEDVRARIIALTLDPAGFVELCHKVHQLVPAPDGGTGHFLLQNILGVWPADGDITETLRSRVQDYGLKAVREAGVHTSWTEPNEQFERAVGDWIDALLSGPATGLISAFVEKLEQAALPISLGRKLLQLCAPGIPDVYQGTELFDDSLVDPDNRRFVDYTRRKQLLAAPPDFSNPDAAKLQLTHAALALRARIPECFVGGSYQAVFAQGPAESKCIGFARGDANGVLHVIAFAVRKPARWQCAEEWENTTLKLPSGTWRDELSGRSYSATVECAELFATLPCCLLVKER
ncbi:malto-oligosyltrehalose synthase [Corynebacterium pelargi]|uniref:Maltooligosyl trehalose synthase n=1 Tax=Corynebacterium pelargi TaxID=1471400 RepID=A0A410W7X7_9CORY|nr:malto-oligosyltrehalose synthase [Corynebacterium pelargi]QAU52066.1 Maltooligosyl trehalose synthase [Corynebacterium pelargi]GGG70384.1 malto-oligosyltrehalose synthase [Corynebacterium pelargi]